MFLLAFFMAPAAVSAQALPPSYILLEPAKQEIVLEPGGETVRYLTLLNQTNELRHFRVEIEDFTASDNPAEVIKLLGTEPGVYSLKNYLAVAQNFQSFTLAPGQKVVISVYLKLPKTISPGGRYGSVLFASEPAEGADKVSLSSRLGALFFVRIKGRVPTAGALKEFGLADHNFHLLFENKGDIYLNPYGYIAVFDLFGREVLFQELEPWFVLPHSLRLYRVPLEHQLWPGYYRAVLKLNRGYEDIIDEQEITFWVGWPWLLALAVIILLAVFFSAKIKKMRHSATTLTLVLLIAVWPLLTARAYVASSTNYRLEFDSINVAGTTSNSTSYRVSDTLGEVATGGSASTNYQIKAGYQQMAVSYVALSTSASSVTLSPSIERTGRANGSATLTVLSGVGYSLSVKASTQPAMRISNPSQETIELTDFTDYAGAPDFTWSVANTASAFGFSPEGNDITSTYKNDGSTCGTGSLTDAHCWDGFSTTHQTIASASTGPKNTTITLNLRAEVGSAAGQFVSSSYAATLTPTLVPL